MRFIVMVSDKRTNSGINTRGKNFDNFEDGVNWCKQVKNRVTKHITVINKTEVRTYEG